MDKTTYGPGGYDPQASDGNVVSVEPITFPPEEENRLTMEQRAAQAVAVNRAFLALASPTNAQTLAQVKHLTRVSSALVRLQLADFTGTD